MTTTAAQTLTSAHSAVFDLASRISDYLSQYENTGATLSFGDIASGCGIDLLSLKRTDSYIWYLAAEAACEFRGWSNVSGKGEPARFRKGSKVTEYRKPAGRKAVA